MIENIGEGIEMRCPAPMGLQVKHASIHFGVEVLQLWPVSCGFDRYFHHLNLFTVSDLILVEKEIVNMHNIHSFGDVNVEVLCLDQMVGCPSTHVIRVIAGAGRLHRQPK